MLSLFSRCSLAAVAGSEVLNRGLFATRQQERVFLQPFTSYDLLVLEKIMREPILTHQLDFGGLVLRSRSSSEYWGVQVVSLDGVI
jgi:hypothetical protein